jgi:SAM-dependent methyltransferase
VTTSNPFGAYSNYYDLLYSDKNYAAETDYIHALLNRFELKGNELLELGSGTGKHGCLLVKHGYNVIGIERSAEMVARAKPSSGFSSSQGDIRTVKLNRKFDAVLALFHVLGYQVSNDDIQSVFKRSAEHLRPGGLFVFDTWYSPAVYAQLPEVRIKRMEDRDWSITRIAEPEIYSNENRIDVRYTIHTKDRQSGACQEFFETHPVRHFSQPELDLLAMDAGFERIAAEEFLTGALPSTETWGVCQVLRKI